MQPRASAPSFSNSIYFAQSSLPLVAKYNLNHHRKNSLPNNFIFEFMPTAFDLLDQPLTMDEKKNLAQTIIVGLEKKYSIYDQGFFCRISGIRLVNNHYEVVYIDGSGENDFVNVNIDKQTIANKIDSRAISWSEQKVNSYDFEKSEILFKQFIDTAVNEKQKAFLKSKTIIPFKADALPLPLRGLEHCNKQQLLEAFKNKQLNLILCENQVLQQFSQLQQQAERNLKVYEINLEKIKSEIEDTDGCTGSLLNNVMQYVAQEPPTAAEQIKQMQQEFDAVIDKLHECYIDQDSQLAYIKKCLAWMLYNAAGRYYETLQKNYSSTLTKKKEHIDSFNNKFFKEIAEIKLDGRLVLDFNLQHSFLHNNFEFIIDFINKTLKKILIDHDSNLSASEKEHSLRETYDALPEDVKFLFAIKEKSWPAKNSMTDFNSNFAFNQLAERINTQQKLVEQDILKKCEFGLKEAGRAKQLITEEKTKIQLKKYLPTVNAVKTSLALHLEAYQKFKELENAIEENATLLQQLKDFKNNEFSKNIIDFETGLVRSQRRLQRIKENLQHLFAKFQNEKNNFIEYVELFEKNLSNLQNNLKIEADNKNGLSILLKESDNIKYKNNLMEAKQAVRDAYKQLSLEYCSQENNIPDFSKHGKKYEAAWKKYETAFKDFDNDEITNLTTVKQKEIVLNRLSSDVSQERTAMSLRLSETKLNPYQVSFWMVGELQSILTKIQDELGRQKEKQEQPFSKKDQAILSARIQVFNNLIKEVTEQKDKLNRNVINENTCKTAVLTLLNNTIKQKKSPLNHNLKYSMVFNLFGHKTDTIKNLEKIQRDVANIGHSKRR